MKVYVDAAFIASDGRVAFGYAMFRSSFFLGVGILRGWRIFFSKEAEMRAILSALKFSMEKGASHITILLDAPEVVKV